MSNVNIGAKLKQARESTGMKQKELAEQLHISAQVLSSYENNKTQPTLDNLVALADVLKVSVDELLGRPCPKAEKHKPSNYADIINLLDTLDDYVWFSAVPAQVYYEYWDTRAQRIAGIRSEDFSFNDDDLSQYEQLHRKETLLLLFSDKTLLDYYKRSNEVMSLVERDTVKYNLYTSWKQDALKDLSEKPAISLWELIVNSDGELP